MTDTRDRLEIAELLNRDQIYIDLADAEGYAGLYAANGLYESPFIGDRSKPKSPGCSAVWAPQALPQTSDASPVPAWSRSSTIEPLHCPTGGWLTTPLPIRPYSP